MGERNNRRIGLLLLLFCAYWRVLMIAKVGIVQHIMKQVSKSIYELQTNINVEDAEISKKYFSEVSSLKMREK